MQIMQSELDPNALRLKALQLGIQYSQQQTPEQLSEALKRCELYTKNGVIKGRRVLLPSLGWCQIGAIYPGTLKAELVVVGADTEQPHLVRLDVINQAINDRRRAARRGVG